MKLKMIKCKQPTTMKILLRRIVSLKYIARDKEPNSTYYIIRKNILVELWKECLEHRKLKKKYKYIISKFGIDSKDYYKILKKRNK